MVNKPRIAWNKGKKLSKEYRKKLSVKAKLRANKPENIENFKNIMNMIIKRVLNIFYYFKRIIFSLITDLLL